MSKLIEAHKLIAQGHALLAEYHAEIPGDAPAPKKEKKQKAAEPALPAVTATPETPAAATTPAATTPVTTPAQTIEAKRDTIRDRFRDFIKSSVDNTAKAKNLLAQYGVGKFGEIGDDKLDAFSASLEAVASPAASDTMI